MLQLLTWVREPARWHRFFNRWLLCAVHNPAQMGLFCCQYHPPAPQEDRPWSIPDISSSYQRN